LNTEGDTGHEGDTGQSSLVEENARLRALVVKLSDLVLRGVVDQHGRRQLLPARQPAMD
jgi:hypothetical protein